MALMRFFPNLCLGLQGSTSFLICVHRAPSRGSFNWVLVSESDFSVFSDKIPFKYSFLVFFGCREVSKQLDLVNTINFDLGISRNGRINVSKQSRTFSKRVLKKFGTFLRRLSDHFRKFQDPNRCKQPDLAV